MVKDNERVEVCKSGLMAVSMRDIGTRIRPMAKVASSMLMVITTSVNGFRTMLMVMVSMFTTKMVPSMQAPGWKTNRMVTALKHGSTGRVTKVTI